MQLASLLTAEERTTRSSPRIKLALSARKQRWIQWASGRGCSRKSWGMEGIKINPISWPLYESWLQLLFQRMHEAIRVFGRSAGELQSAIAVEVLGNQQQ